MFIIVAMSYYTNCFLLYSNYTVYISLAGTAYHYGTIHQVRVYKGKIESFKRGK
jgi:hypothetical protein